MISRTYPCFCDCCDPKKELKHRQALYYHLKVRNSKTMPPKKAKVSLEDGNIKRIANAKLDENMKIFREAVIRGDLTTIRLEDIVEITKTQWHEEGLEEEIRAICIERINDWIRVHSEERDEIETNIHAAEEHEQKWLMSLKEKSKG